MGGPMALKSESVFVFHNAKVYPSLERWSRQRPHSVLGRTILKLSNHVRNGQSIRSREYMETLAQSLFPEFQASAMLTVEEDGFLPQIDWQRTSEVILLWPDANGMGWRGIENQVLRNAPSGARITAVNGRRRRLALTRGRLTGVRWKRFLEKTLAFELAFTVAFVLITPALILSDFVRRRS
jgi:hypothetical protein